MVDHFHSEAEFASRGHRPSSPFARTKHRISAPLRLVNRRSGFRLDVRFPLLRGRARNLPPPVAVHR